MNYSIVPLTTNPNQKFDITIPMDNKNIRLHLNINYNGIAGYWTMDITDKVTNKSLVCGIPLVTGEYPAGDLLEQYEYLNIGSAIIVPKSKVLEDYPDATNLGTDFFLMWGDRA